MIDRLPRAVRRRLAAVTVCLAVPVSVQAQAPPPETQNTAMERYLAAARGAVPDANLWMHGLALDLRARRLNDLVTVRIEESIVASGSADSTLTKSSSS